MLGEAAGAGGKPGMTGTLTIVYRRGTPLGDLRAEAWIDRVEGIKTYAKGHLKDAEGVTVEAEGVFILPKWAREPHDAEHADADATSSRPRLSSGCHAEVDAALAGVGEPGLLERPRLQLRRRCSSAAGRLDASGGETRSAAPCSSRPSAARPKICCSVAVRSARPRPRNETSQCSTAVTRFLKPVM